MIPPTPFACTERGVDIPPESYDPDNQSDLDQWVNFNAYLANLDALNFWGAESRFCWRTMAYAFKHSAGQSDGWYRDPEDEQVGVKGRDANVLAAAQWILWNGQNVRRHALYRGPPKGSTLSDERYFGLETTDTTLSRWQLWKEGFKSASEEKTASQETRDAALRSFTLMDALEKTMPS